MKGHQKPWLILTLYWIGRISPEWLCMLRHIHPGMHPCHMILHAVEALILFVAPKTFARGMLAEPMLLRANHCVNNWSQCSQVKISMLKQKCLISTSQSSNFKMIRIAYIIIIKYSLCRLIMVFTPSQCFNDLNYGRNVKHSQQNGQEYCGFAGPAAAEVQGQALPRHGSPPHLISYPPLQGRLQHPLRINCLTLDHLHQVPGDLHFV